MSEVKFVKADKAEFEPDKPATIPKDDEGKFATHRLIWGEPVEVLGDAGGGRVNVKAWGKQGTMAAKDLGDERLLELYVIDVAQGDGLLVHTPDDKWHLIDAGNTSANQQLNKGAPNFIGWKFRNGLGRDTVSFENVMFTHADLDHFGGLIDVLNRNFGPVDEEHPPLKLEVQNFYHPGIAKWKDAPILGKTKHGEVGDFPHPGQEEVDTEVDFITEVIDGRDSFENPPRPFAETFGKLAKLIVTEPKGKVRRIDSSIGHLPGYEPDGPDKVAIKVLGPVYEDFDGVKALRMFDHDDSHTVNGHSIVLRLDYGDARILLTGDLNDVAQRLLLSYIAAEEFAADVAKGCHHGAEEIDLGFVKAMAARSTVISSGDNENFSHPRPFAVGASARYGREGIDASKKDRGRTLPPLVYSTELARSTQLQAAKSVTVPDEDTTGTTREVDADDAKVRVKDKPPRGFDVTPLATGLIYGLVNVRTDGKRILCAIHNEEKHDFDVIVFEANKSPG
jgi:beta-lactamase superfamily II metal-dependent hydrolase